MSIVFRRLNYILVIWFTLKNDRTLLRLFRTIKSELNIRFVSIVILVCLTAISYHPRFANLVIDNGTANPLNIYIYLMTAICFLLHIDVNRWISSGFIRLSLLLLVFIAISLVCLFPSPMFSRYMGDLMGIAMSLSFLLIGYNSRFTRNQLIILTFSYSVAVAISTACQIIINIGGFYIADLYMQYGKNTLGVMAASSAIAVLFVALENEKSIKNVSYVIFAILLFFTITIRARAAFLTIFAVSGLLLYRKNKTAYKKIFTTKFILVCIFILLLLLVISPNMFSIVGNYLYDSFTQNQGSDLTSDRSSRNAVAMDFILNHPLLGNVEVGQRLQLVHNYLLRVLSNYGLIFSFPIICLYLVIVKRIFQFTVKGTPNITRLGHWVMVVPLIISLAEPTFPFAPGTGVIFPFISWGWSLWMSDNQESVYMSRNQN